MSLVICRCERDLRIFCRLSNSFAESFCRVRQSLWPLIGGYPMKGINDPVIAAEDERRTSWYPYRPSRNSPCLCRLQRRTVSALHPLLSDSQMPSSRSPSASTVQALERTRDNGKANSVLIPTSACARGKQQVSRKGPESQRS
jgi:hypothetical protein